MQEPHNPDSSIALLIDADNAPAAKIDFIIAELASYGTANIRRAYGNWKKRGLSGWERILNEYAIQPVQRFDLVKGKNATDMSLTIDALDILYTRNADVFALVTSDCDFTPLARRLREEGKIVVGFGGHQTPEPFSKSCSKFLFLDEDETAKKSRKEKAKNPAILKGDTRLMNLLRNAVEAVSDEEGWAPLGEVGSHISNQGSFDQRNYGFPKLSDLFRAIDVFEVQKVSVNGGSPQLSVREKR